MGGSVQAHCVWSVVRVGVAGGRLGIIVTWSYDKSVRGAGRFGAVTGRIQA